MALITFCGQLQLEDTEVTRQQPGVISLLRGYVIFMAWEKMVLDISNARVD